MGHLGLGAAMDAAGEDIPSAERRGTNGIWNVFLDVGGQGSRMNANGMAGVELDFLAWML